MATACVTLKGNTHLANSKAGYFLGKDNGFLGERIKGKGSFNNNAWVTDQLSAKRLTTKKRLKTGSVSAILTSDDPKGSMVILISTVYFTIMNKKGTFKF